jgi:group I intron endonuclease
MPHCIYLYENKINHKKYVGQTNNAHLRYNGHKSSAYNEKDKSYHSPLSNAIRKYGLENFDFSILEEIDDSKDQVYIDEREIYYISEYKSLTTQEGYNVLPGGQGGRPQRKKTVEECYDLSKIFTREEILDIQNSLILNKTSKEIYDKYPDLTPSFLSNINKGYNFNNSKFNYPLRKEKNWKSERFTKEDILNIKNKIKSGKCYSEIAQKYSISYSFISMINTGKYYYNPNETYPLCNKNYRAEDTKIWAEGIIDDILHSKMSLMDISKKWNKSYSTVKNINSGKSHNKKELHYPLR